MQFWPLAVLVLGSGLFAVTAIAAMIRLHKPHSNGISPHHRWNRRTDALIASEAAASQGNR